MSKKYFQEQQEPVAWMFEHNGQRLLTLTDQRKIEEKYLHFEKAVPLYTHPAQPVQPAVEQEPFTWALEWWDKDGEYEVEYSTMGEFSFGRKKGFPLYRHPAQPVQPAGAQELRYTADRALAECPCCGSLDVGGVHDTVNCYGCGLTVTAPRPLQNAINKWNQRTNKAPAPAGAQPPAVAVNEQFAVLIKKANDQAEHFEREWYLRGDELEALEQVNAQLLEALKELMYARTDKAEGMAEAAIAAAEAEKAKGGAA